MTLFSAGLDRHFCLGRKGPPYMGTVFEGTQLTSFAACERGSVAVHEDGSISAWGQNADFELGIGPTQVIDPVETFSRDDVGFHAVAVVGQGRRMSYLAADGAIFISGLPFRSNRRMGLVVPERRAVALCCGPHDTYAIDGSGRIVHITTEVVNVWKLTDGRAVSVAAGDDFAVAVSAYGRCYGLGRVTGTPDFTLIPSLSDTAVATVYAFGSTVAVVTRTGHALMSAVDSPLAPVAIPDNAPVSQVALGDGFSLFLLTDGRVAACGSNEYCQLFTADRCHPPAPFIIADLEGVTAIAAGATHSLAYRGDGARRAVAAPPRSDFAPAGNALVSSGLFFGDIVDAGGERGFVSGFSPDGVAVAGADGVRVCPAAEVQFVSRNGFVGVPHEGALLDGGRLLNRLFGVREGDVVRGRGGLAVVVGLHGDAVVLRRAGREERLFNGSAALFFREYTVVQSERRIETIKVGGIELPVEVVEPFFARFKAGTIRVVGKWAAFWVADSGSGKLGLYHDSEVFLFGGAGKWFEGDRVRRKEVAGTVVAVIGDTIVMLPDGMADCVAMPAAELELVATFARTGDAGGLCLSAFGGESFAALPGDLFVGANGFVSIAGFRDGKTVAEDGTEVDFSGLFLVRRELPWGESRATVVSGADTVVVSRFAADIAPTGFCHGDEIAIGGETAVVVGTDGLHVWMVGTHGELFAAEDHLGEGDAKLVKRPTDNPKLLFDCLSANKEL